MYYSADNHDTLDEMYLSLEMPGQMVAIDLETNSLNPYERESRVTSISITRYDEETYVVPIAHPSGSWGFRQRQLLAEIADALSNQNLIAHNAMFDLVWIRAASGVDLSDSLYWDTQTVAHLLNENQSKRLKNLAAPLMGGDWGIDVRDTMNTPWFTLAKYNADDTVATMRLYKQQYEVMEQNHDLLHLYENVVRLAERTLLRVRQRGVRLDPAAAHAALRAAQSEAMDAATSLLDRAYDYGMSAADYPKASWAPTSKWFIAFTEKACEADDLYVMEVTGTGRPSWRGAVLDRLSREGYELADKMLAYRHGTKQAEFLNTWLDAAEYDGRIHANFNVARTSTGRLSSSDPNMQQVARDLKPVFGARRGWYFVEADYSQIEMRIAAEFISRKVSKRNPMLEAYEQGLDLHKIAATLAVGGSPDDVSKEDRQKGKAINFGFLFGMGADKFVTYADEVYGEKFSIDEARRIRHGFFTTWEGLADWHEAQRQEARDNGYVLNLFGRHRRLPDVFTTDRVAVAAAERQAINAPVQSTASDLMLCSLARLDSLPHSEAMLVGTVHDSALLEIASPDLLDSVCAAMLEPPIDLTVPLEVEATASSHWGGKPIRTLTERH